MGPEPAAGAGQRGGLAGDNLKVLLAGQGVVAPVVYLLKLTLADCVRRLPDEARRVLGVERTAKMESVADEVVAEQNGRLVAGPPADGGVATADVGFVQDVVVHECGHVHQLDHGRQRMVLLRDLPARPGGQQQQPRAKHLAPILPDVRAEFVDHGQVGEQLVVENLADFLQIVSDRFVQG